MNKNQIFPHTRVCGKERTGIIHTHRLFAHEPIESSTIAINLLYNYIDDFVYDIIDYMVVIVVVDDDEVMPICHITILFIKIIKVLHIDVLFE